MIASRAVTGSLSSPPLQLVLRGGGGVERSRREKMVAAIRVPKTKRARRELLKHAPKLVSFLLCPLPPTPTPVLPAARGVLSSGGRI